MAKHEFGIFETEPEPGKRYDEYSPEKYDCIAWDMLYSAAFFIWIPLK